MTLHDINSSPEYPKHNFICYIMIEWLQHVSRHQNKKNCAIPVCLINQLINKMENYFIANLELFLPSA